MKQELSLQAQNELLKLENQRLQSENVRLKRRLDAATRLLEGWLAELPRRVVLRVQNLNLGRAVRRRAA